MSAAAASVPPRLAPGLLLAAGGAVAFSGKAIIVKLAYRHGVDSVTLIMLRMAFALPLFVLLAWWSGRRRPWLSARDWRLVGLLGFSGYYLSSFLDFCGLRYVSASLERLVLYLNPTIVLILGRLLFGRRVGRRQVAAMALSYTGVLLVFGVELGDVGADAALGTALVFGSAFSYAIYLIYSGEALRRIGSLRLTGLATSVACMLCIGQFLLLRPVSTVSGLSAAVIQLSVLNAIACTFAPVLMLMLAIERLGPALAAQIGMIGPMSTIVMGVLLLGEPFTIWVAAGTLLVLAGVGLVTRRPPPPA